MPCEARTRGSGEVLCAKSTFFSLFGHLLWNGTKEARALCGFQQHHKGGNLFCLLFSDPIIVGLIYGKRPGNRRPKVGVSLLGVETVLRFEKDAWSMVK